MANKYKGEITADGRLLVDLPRGIEPGQVDVIIRRAHAGKRVPPGADHPAFGLWAERGDVTDSAEYADELRRRVETGRDGRD